MTREWRLIGLVDREMALPHRKFPEHERKPTRMRNHGFHGLSATGFHQA